MRIKSNQQGFTLIEIAIVLIVVTILLGYTVAMFPIQQELRHYRQVNAEMEEIKDALIAFAQVNGRLPCPDTNGNINGTGAGVIDGFEDGEDLIVNSNGTAGTDNQTDDCKAFYGFLPSATLGLDGNINASGLLQDPWGGAYRYAVSDVNTDVDSVATTAAGIDLVSAGGIREEGLSNVNPDLFICSGSNELGNDDSCDDVTGGRVVTNVAVAIISLGKDSSVLADQPVLDGDGNPVTDTDGNPVVTIGTSYIQRENLDDFNDGTNDKVYISSTRSDVEDAEYDDIVKWISPNLLFSKMIEADQLP